MPHETWLPVPGYEGSYEVSDYGRVRSVDRIDASGNRRRGRAMSQSFTHNGYPKVTLTKFGKERVRKVHHLVLEAFCGVCPEGMEACHGNGTAADCRLNNLRWDTKLANAADKRTHGTMYCGERHHSAKLTRVEVAEVFEMRAAGKKLREIAAALNVSTSLVSAILLGQKWKHQKEAA